MEHVSGTPTVVTRMPQGDATFEPFFPIFVVDAFLHSLGNKEMLGNEGEPQPEMQDLFGWRLEKRVPSSPGGTDMGVCASSQLGCGSRSWSCQGAGIPSPFLPLQSKEANTPTYGR